ncbi:hypothetical protein GPA10_11895 [Streptomyces sp. p1417]|uniref:Uncharacterized protein n=1 Tax=Streptomyces typhae TaxID=2681492 RepID=A0A6L6WX21_9ACTN|nr:DUF6185 family protein [Streptomyces typhae]MVO85436.1 hypothetical protein [Streptomyces typhae]
MWLLSVCLAAPAAAASDDICASAGLRATRVQAEARIDHDDRTYSKVFSTVTLTVPMSWTYADELLLSKDSDAYRKAMRCLARGSMSGLDTRWEEWRSAEPEVTPTADPTGVRTSRDEWLRVRLVAHAWVDQEGSFPVGPWTLDVGKAHWTLRLTPPAALKSAWWEQVTVDPGRPGALSAAADGVDPDGDTAPGTGATAPRAGTDKGRSVLVWPSDTAVGAPAVAVRVEPSWPRSFSAQDDSSPYAAFDAAGGLLWTVALVLTLWYALRVLPRHGVPDPVEQRAVANLRGWSLALLVVSVVVRGPDIYLGAIGAFGGDASEEWDAQAVHAPWAWLTSAVAGAVLLYFARVPRWLALTGGVLGAGAVVPAVLWAVGGFDPGRFVRPGSPGGWTVAAVVVAGVCSFALPLLGGAAAVRRLLVDGGLRPNRRARPRPWPLIGGVLAVVAVIGVCYLVASERDWNRASWLSPHMGAPDYGGWHRSDLRNNLLWFTPNARWWWFAMLWVPTGLAVLAVLRSRVAGTAADSLARRGPQGADRLLLLLLFPVMAAMDLGVYTASGAFVWCWFFLYLVALASVLRLTRGRAVAARPLDRSGEPLGTALSASHRAGLLDRARRHRELHAQLRRLDQGQPDEGTSRRDLETRLRRLHRWRTAAGRPDRLPSGVSVVDAALALGPCRTWWENGVKAARLTQPIALPLSAGLVWTNQLRGEALTGTLYDRLGLPDVLTQLVLWQVGYAAAGFLFGALWQELPGRRGPVKAIPLALAYAAPIGVFALGNWGLGEEQTALAFGAMAILLVLTLTGLMMDLETFRGEHPYWRGRLSLLRSVYQMRYMSVQLAWVLAQAAAVVTVLQYLADNGGMPPQFGGGGR